MRKIVVFLLMLTVVLLTISCGGNTSVFTDFEYVLVLEIRTDESTAESCIILAINKTDKGYRGKITEPDELANVSLLYENETVTLISDTVELPFGEKAGAGFAVIFKAIDDLSVFGAPEEGRQIDIDGYRVEFDPSPTQRKIAFTINGAGLKRSCVLRERDEAINEREPETTG